MRTEREEQSVGVYPLEAEQGKELVKEDDEESGRELGMCSSPNSKVLSCRTGWPL